MTRFRADERAWESSFSRSSAYSDLHQPACTCLSNVPFLANVQPVCLRPTERLFRIQDTFCIQRRSSSLRRSKLRLPVESTAPQSPKLASAPVVGARIRGPALPSASRSTRPFSRSFKASFHSSGPFGTHRIEQALSGGLRNHAHIALIRSTRSCSFSMSSLPIEHDFLRSETSHHLPLSFFRLFFHAVDN